ncbi:hypothetical protein D3C87_1252980 [compost metagenome]
MVLGYVTTSKLFKELHFEFQTARDYRDFQWLDFQTPKLSCDQQPTQLRHYQQFSISIVKSAFHRAVC